MLFPWCLSDSDDVPANLLCQLNGRVVPIMWRYGQFPLCLASRDTVGGGGDG